MRVDPVSSTALTKPQLELTAGAKTKEPRQREEMKKTLILPSPNVWGWSEADYTSKHDSSDGKVAIQADLFQVQRWGVKAPEQVEKQSNLHSILKPKEFD